jgi:ferredoxin
MARITFIEPSGAEKSVEAENGLSLLDVARAHDVDVEGACEGSLACSTCHVIVEERFFDLLEPPSDEEEDMLDLAFGLTETSRLGCQIIVTDELDGLRVKVARGNG